MGLLDIFRSPENRSSWNIRSWPNHTVAKIVSYNEYDREESCEEEDSQTQRRMIREAIVTFRYMVGGPWQETTCGPSEGYRGFTLEEQVKYSGGIAGFGQTLRRDSVNRI